MENEQQPKEVKIENKTEEELKEIVDENESLLKRSLIPEEQLPPIILDDGEPYQIINEKYVPYDEAQIVFQERKIEKEKIKLEYLKRVATRNKLLKEKARKEIEKAKKEREKEALEREKLEKIRKEDLDIF